ncbi:hypothetical protein C1645_839334 [Glomus cerebriforme]|uniref:Uncharacterized protein n=1 Tax=Glomus cerebriforme TaxID=658196 RepID=A0A397S0X7_9GLOM|nr:hypothetical protein C1645_839334 [Glomus cerebriforme]
MISHQNINANNQPQITIYDLLAEKLTYPVTQDMNEQFQKLACGVFRQIFAMHQGLYQQLISVKNTTFQNTNEYFKNILDNWPESYSIHCEHAYVLKQLVSKVLQMLHLKKSIPNHIANKNINVECLREQGDFKKYKYKLTMQVLDQLLQWKTKDHNALLLRGKTNEVTNNFDLAITNFNDALLLYPEDPYLIN